MGNPYARGKQGNKSRTGMPKPRGSGMKAYANAARNLTIRITNEQYMKWLVLLDKRIAEGAERPSLGSLVREAMDDMLDKEV